MNKLWFLFPLIIGIVLGHTALGHFIWSAFAALLTFTSHGVNSL
jgi:hypothetical protein